MRNLHIIISVLFIMLSTQCIGMENNNSSSEEITYVGKLAKNSISQYEMIPIKILRTLGYTISKHFC